MKICIFGGSFNPIHNGHMALASVILQQSLADEVWLMVTPQNPLKQSAELLDEDTRLLLAKLATARDERVKACDFEFHLPRPSYTWQTLSALLKHFPQHDFSFLIGGDNWENFSKWANPDYILSNAEIIVYPRPGVAFDDKAMPENVRLLHNVTLFANSSTDIRNKIKNGESIADLVPSEVAAYISEHKLYQHSENW